MAQSARLVGSDGNLAMGVFGAAVLVGLGVAAVTYARDRSAHRHGGARAKGAALVTYLREHLSASDAAIDVVERLRLTHAGSQEGRLFASLFDEFREERDVVRLLLEQIGVAAVPRASRRAGGRLDAHARQRRRAWRTVALPDARGPGHRRPSQTLHVAGARIAAGRRADSERAQPRRARGDGRRQWEAIEERRRGLVGATFPTLRCRRWTCRSTDAVHIRPGTNQDAAALAAFAARTFAETFAADSSAADMQAHLSHTYGIAQQTEELASPTGDHAARRSGLAAGRLRRGAARLPRRPASSLPTPSSCIASTSICWPTAPASRNA